MNTFKSPVVFLRRAWACLAAAVISLSSVDAQCGSCGTSGTQTLDFSGSAIVKNGSITVTVDGKAVSGSISGEGLAKTSIGTISIEPGGDPYDGTVTVTSELLSGSGCSTVATVVLDPGSTCGYIVECCKVDNGVEGEWSDDLTLQFTMPSGGSSTATKEFRIRITEEEDEEEEEEDENDSSSEGDGSSSQASPPSIPDDQQDLPPAQPNDSPAQVTPAGISHSVSLAATPQTAGRNAGSLVLAAPISASTANPALLKVTNPFGLTAPVFQIIAAGGLPVAQVKTEVELADVQLIQTGGFKIVVYQATDVFAGQAGQPYSIDPTAQPLRQYRYEPIAAVSGQHLGGIRITTEVAGKAPESREYLSTLGTGTGYRIVGPGGLQVTDYLSTFFYQGGHWVRIDQETVSRGGSTYSKTQRDYQYQVRRENSVIVQSRQFLLQEARSTVTGHTADLITTYEPAPGFIGRAKSVIRPDGSWEVYEYYGNEADITWRGRVKKVLRPWNGLPEFASDADGGTGTQNCEVTTFTYTSGGIGGVVVDEEVTTLPAVGIVKKETAASTTWVPVTGTGGIGDLLQLAGIHSEWVPAAANIHEKSRLRWASANESLKSTNLTHVRSTGPARPWKGRSAGSFDAERRGSLIGYELGAYNAGVFTPNTTANGGTGTHVKKITVEVQGSTGSPVTLAFPVLGESTKTEVIEDKKGHVLREQLFVRTGSNTWDLATETTYEYVFWSNGSVQEVIRKHDGRVVERILEVSRLETRSWDEQGIETRTVRDVLGRTVSVTVVGMGTQPNVVTSYIYSGRTVTRLVSGGGLSLTTSSKSDWAGRPTSSTDETGAVTLTSYFNGTGSTYVTLPGGATRSTFRNLDGRIINISGTAVVQQQYEYEALTGGNLRTTARTGDLTNSPRYVRTVTDWAGRTISKSLPNPTGDTADIVVTTSYASGTRRVVSVSSSAANVAPVLTSRPDASSNVIYQGYDVDGGGLAPVSSDRLTETRRYYEVSGGLWWEVSSKKVYDVNWSGTSAITTISKRRLHGSADGLASVSVQISPFGEQVTTQVTFDRSETAKSRTQTVIRSTSNLQAVTVNINGLKVSKTSHVSVQPTTYGYDGLGRKTSEKTPAGAATRTAYKTNGQVDTVTDPFGKVTSYAYHSATSQGAGRVATITNPDGKTTTYTYTARAEVSEIAGTAQYRQTFMYDDYGQKTNLITWRDATHSDPTTWSYQVGTGLLEEKNDGNGNGTSYYYHASGKLGFKLVARGGQADYSYNAYGDLTGIDYSDATPDVTMPSLDRIGRPLEINQAGLGSETLSYYPGKGSLVSRSYSSGHALLPSAGVAYLEPREDGSSSGFFEIQAYPNTTNASYRTYEYDARNRLSVISDGYRYHRYSYDAVDSRVESVDWLYGGVQFLQRRNYDVAGRLLAIHSDALSGGTVATPLTRYGYELDSLGRRKKATMVDGSNWNYGYNDRSEVTSAVRKNTSGTAIPALGATYSYDGIGNRLSSTSPVLGDRTYSPNSLNQYASITTSATRTVTGRAPAAEGVSVNGTALTGGNRISDIFHFTLPAAANANSPVWQNVTVVSQGTTIDRAFYHPKAVTAPTYDLDGNLVNDGRWVYSWDLENRLTQMESTTQAVSAGAPYRKLVFRYDAGGRRLSKAVYHGTAATPVFFSSTRWVYDGWNPISEFTATAETGGTVTRTKSYTWGLDLAGSLQGAGGVGGLLAVSVHNGFSTTNYCPSYDGNGNIVAWTLEGQTVPVARREYDAFGNTLVEQGTAPSAYGFSTKLGDTETGLCYYGFRYYDPVTGRWPSRDPLGEEGGVNLYGFVSNSSIDLFDPDGKAPMSGGFPAPFPPFIPPGGIPEQPPTVPGTNIPTGQGPIDTATAVKDYLEGRGYYTCPKWGLKYKSGFTGGDIQHCMFGCLYALANASLSWTAGATEIESSPEWVDFKADYVGAFHGLFSSKLSDCEDKCRKWICCP